MSFIVPGNKGNFLNAKLVKEKGFAGKTALITEKGEIKDFISKEGKTKAVWNIPIRILHEQGMVKEEPAYIFTPNATNLEIMTKAWGKDKMVDGIMQRGIEQEDVVGKTFKINLVQVKFKGELMDGIQM